MTEMDSNTTGVPRGTIGHLFLWKGSHHPFFNRFIIPLDPNSALALTFDGHIVFFDHSFDHLLLASTNNWSQIA